MRYVHSPIATVCLSIGMLAAFSTVDAQILSCKNNKIPACHSQFSTEREALRLKQQTASLVSDAPLKLLNDTQDMWLTRLNQCRSITCTQQQFEQRMDELDLYTSLNQSLTQHFIRYEQGEIAQPMVHLKVHQLDKSNLKIEGVAWRNPNNRIQTQQISFLAYSSTKQKNQIRNNEQKCDYSFDFQKAILKVTSEQDGCERFNGIYRLYD